MFRYTQSLWDRLDEWVREDPSTERRRDTPQGFIEVDEASGTVSTPTRCSCGCEEFDTEVQVEAKRPVRLTTVTCNYCDREFLYRPLEGVAALTVYETIHDD